MQPPDEGTRTTVVVALTVHNRRALTLRCIESIVAQDVEGVDLHIVLFDDGSTDGTAQAVRAAHPDVEVLTGDGTFFWNGGMRVALATAMRRNPDHLLWVNDDTVLAPHALRTLLRTWVDLAQVERRTVIIAGAIADPESGEVNYSGVVQHPVRRMWFRPVSDPHRPVMADTMNGNCVLVPRGAWSVLGNLDPAYVHSMGDFDYGLRTRGTNIEVWVAPGVLGECDSNPGFIAMGGPVVSELRRLATTKHLPGLEWLRFTRRWGGPFWVVYWTFPYLRRLTWIVKARLHRRGA